MFSKPHSNQPGKPLNKNHATQFIIDFRNASGGQDTLQDYVERETDYDLAFCDTWQSYFGKPDFKKVSQDLLFGKENNTNILEKIHYLMQLLEKIQIISLQHLADFKTVGNKYKPLKGRAKFNWFGLVKDHTADEKGICHLVNAILTGEKQGFNILQINTDSPTKYFLVNETGLIAIRGQEMYAIDYSKEQIIDFVVTEFNKGKCQGKQLRLGLQSVKSIEERITQEQKLFQIFFEKMQHADTEQAKIETIATTMQDIMQLHIYCDGNGRSLFILANWLFWLLDIPLFYPDNMCIFDANSLKKMCSEIAEGQDRFRDLFSDELTLTTALTSYRESILKLSNLINNSKLPKNDLQTLNTNLKKRNVNILFRQSAAHAEGIKILKFLIENKDILNINIYEKGQKSGKDALDVAKDHANDLAINELSCHWPCEPSNHFTCK